MDDNGGRIRRDAASRRQLIVMRLAVGARPNDVAHELDISPRMVRRATASADRVLAVAVETDEVEARCGKWRGATACAYRPEGPVHMRSSRASVSNSQLPRLCAR